MRSTGAEPGPELTGGAPIDPSTSPTASTADYAECGEQGEPAGGRTRATPVDEQIGAATASVTKAVDDVIVTVRTLVGTEEGRRYIETQVHRAGDTLVGVLKDLGKQFEGPRKP